MSSRRDPTPQESDIHVGTPIRGSTQRISTKYATSIRTIASGSAIFAITVVCSTKN